MTHASEGGHWYDREGVPVYEVAAKDGAPRPTTLRDARKLNLFPSVTGIIRCAAAPGLERWKAEQLMLAALTLSRAPEEPESAWLERVRRDSQEQARKAAQRGTEIHAAIQGHYEGHAPSEELWPYIKGAVEAVKEWRAGEPWVAERSFSHPLGFGGKIDLFSPQAVLDFKSKEFGPEVELSTWDEHHMQLAAYRDGILLPRATAAICYVSTRIPGLAKVVPVSEEKLSQGWDMFKALLSYWQAKNGYRPQWEKEAA